MVGQAPVPGLHAQHAPVRVRMGGVAGETGDHPVREGQSLDIHGRDDIDLVFGRRLPVAMAVETEGRKLLPERSDLLGSRRKMAQETVLLDFRERIIDWRSGRRLEGGPGAGGRNDASATSCNDSECSKVRVACFSLPARPR
jgi:hypothetical protein